MKRTFGLLGAVLIFLLLASSVSASVIQYDGGTYVSPEGYSEIATGINSTDPYIHSLTMRHGMNYEWTINDLSGIVDLPDQDEYLNIIFHNIYNNQEPQDDSITLYIKNDSPAAQPGLAEIADPHPWEGWTPFEGEWGYPAPPGHYGYLSYAEADKYDVVFSILIDDTILDWLTDGGTFTIGIDSNCYYLAEKVTAEAPAPVPEPATMPLLGTGLLGLAKFSRKGKRQKRD